MNTWKEILTPKVLINSGISGGLVLFGACSTGHLSLDGFLAAFAAGMIAFLTQLKDDIFPTAKKGSLRPFEFI